MGASVSRQAEMTSFPILVGGSETAPWAFGKAEASAHSPTSAESSQNAEEGTRISELYPVKDSMLKHSCTGA